MCLIETGYDTNSRGNNVRFSDFSLKKHFSHVYYFFIKNFSSTGFIRLTDSSENTILSGLNLNFA